MTYPYTSEKPPLPRSVEELRAAIPGWGVDLDPADRPAVPKLQARPGLGGGDPEPPERQTERQTERWPRERSIEHAMLTPVFGTACPPKGLSGLIRRLAYARYSEARSAHWLLLLGADRVDMLESTLGSLLTRRPDNLLAETGIRSELTHQGISSRIGRRRADLVHQPLDPVIVLGPWVLAGYGAVSAVRRVARLRRTR